VPRCTTCQQPGAARASGAPDRGLRRHPARRHHRAASKSRAHGEGFFRVILHFGFTEADVPQALKLAIWMIRTSARCAPLTSSAAKR
jgi:hypothetical protein